MIWDFLVVQWLKFCASNAGDASLIPGWGNMIPHAMWYGQKQTTKTKTKIAVLSTLQRLLQLSHP